MAAKLNQPVRVAHIATIDLTVWALLLQQLRGLHDAGFIVSAISAPGPWVDQIEAAGIRHIPWRSVTRSWDPASDVRAFFELVRILGRERFDIVHTHTPKPGVMGRIAARLVGIPCVVNTVHGFNARTDDRPLKRAGSMGLEWLAARFSDLEFYQGEADLERARHLRVASPRKSVFLGNGTDLTRFDPRVVPERRLASLRHELGMPEGILVIETIGRLVGEKGYRELFDAARKVRARFPHVRFLAIGDRDPAKPDAITEAEVERAKADFVFTGWREDVRDLLALADVFVLASWREGVPRSAIEAAAMSRPLILTDIPGCRQVARHGMEGLLVPPRDPDRLATAICCLLADPALRHRLGRAARRRAVNRFDERKVVGVLIEQYGCVLRCKGLHR